MGTLASGVNKRPGTVQMKAGEGCGGWGSQAGRGMGFESDLDKLGRYLDRNGRKDVLM